VNRDPADGLTVALGRRPPDGIAALGAETLDFLADAVHERRAHQADALRASLDAALRIAPRPLRPVLRKVLVG
jgi:hypothetical protein